MSYELHKFGIDHGKIVPIEPEKLPEKGKGILTITSGGVASIARQGPRPIGLAKGDFEVPSDFNAPLPPDVLKSFEPE